MNKIFPVDIDGCCLDFTTGIIDFVKNNSLQYNIDPSDEKFGLKSEKEISKLVNLFNQSVEFSELKPFQDTLEFMTKISKEFNYKFVAVTTCLGNEITKKLREKNIKNVFGDLFEDVICLPIGTSKLKTLQQFNPSFYVDDKLKHVNDSYSLGYISFYMQQPYNINIKSKKEIVDVYNWKEIYEKIRLIESINSNNAKNSSSDETIIIKSSDSFSIIDKKSGQIIVNKRG